MKDGSEDVIGREKRAQETRAHSGGPRQQHRDVGGRRLSRAPTIPEGGVLGVRPVPAPGRDGADDALMYLLFTLQPGGRVAQPVPKDYNAFAYIVDGAGSFGEEGEQGTDGQMVMFAPDGDEVRIENPAHAEFELDVLLIAGVPLNDPVARYGPFVMNTEAEIRQAFEDYRSGRMGAINF